MTQQPRARDDGAVSAEAIPDRHRATWAEAAVTVGVLDAVALTVAFVLSADRDLLATIDETGSWINLVAGPTFPLLAAVLLRPRGHAQHRPAHQDRLAWLFLAFGALCTATLVLHVAAGYGLDHHTAFAGAAAWVSLWLWVGVPTGLLLLLLWFPTGDAPGPRWRPAVGGVAVAFVAIWLAAAFYPGEMRDDFPGHDNPLGWAAGDHLLRVVGFVGFFALAVTAMVTVASLVWRFHSGDAAVRAQLRWLLVAVGLNVVIIAVPTPAALDGLSMALAVLGAVLLPVTLAVALVRRDGLVLPRVLVYGLLSTVLLAAYLAVVGAAQAIFGSAANGVATVVAAGVVAVLVAPLRARLQRSVDRLVYGDRGDPYVALSDLGRRIAGSPDDLLHEVVLAVVDALHAPYAAVVLAGDSEPTAAVGRPGIPEVAVPLVLRGDVVGSLVVARRGPRERYGERDLRLLDDLARHIAVAAHAASLTRDLRRSRESLVVAREEERRRIRRDLHDGLGPALAGVAFGIDAVRNTLSRNPQETDGSLAQLKREVQVAIADVRRLVDNLRPPALDQLGLVPALEEYAARLSERGALEVSVCAPVLPNFPAAVEVAAYRIATEALTNAARHSGGGRATVAFGLADGTLRLEVLDDGVGLPTQHDPRGHGVGLAAMAERAAELGGTCSVDRRAGGGTAVIALLPLGAGS